MENLYFTGYLANKGEQCYVIEGSFDPEKLLSVSLSVTFLISSLDLILDKSFHSDTEALELSLFLDYIQFEAGENSQIDVGREILESYLTNDFLTVALNDYCLSKSAYWRGLLSWDLSGDQVILYDYSTNV